jgi:predicted branched-subunit amino acid permease
MSLTNWVMWQVGSLLGIYMAGFIPQSWGLEFAGTLALIAIVMPMLKERSALFSACAAGSVALFTAFLPYRLNLVLAVIVAIIVGVGFDKLRISRRKS